MFSSFSSFSPSAEAHRLVIHHRLNLTIRPVEHTASSRRFADCSAGVVHPSRQVCCNATCGLCGGHGCSGRPGGPRECCMPAILRTGRVCESRADVACILRGSSNYIRGDGVEHRSSSGEGFPRAPPPPLPSPQAHAQTQANLGTKVTPALSHDVEAASSDPLHQRGMKEQRERGDPTDSSSFASGNLALLSAESQFEQTIQSYSCPSGTGLKFPPAHAFANSTKPLIIMAGEGFTGTRGVHAAVAQLGFVSAHWDQVMVPSRGTPFRAERDPVLTERFVTIRRFLTQLKLGSHIWRHTDFRMFDFVDCVSDLPITQFFPFLFAAYPYAKVILTVRDPNKWAKQRSKKWSRTDPAPLQTMFHTVGDAVHMNTSVGTMNWRSPYVLQLLYVMHNLMVMCMVPKEQLLVLNVFEEEPPTLWARLARFLDATPPPTRSAFPKGAHRAVLIHPNSSVLTADGKEIGPVHQKNTVQKATT